MTDINTIITNKLLNNDGNHYSGIIGLNPSQGARSPKLWNKVYQSIGSSVRMHPIDVNINNVEELLIYLNNEEKFIGGSIAVPHKVIIFDLLKDNLSKEVKLIGAINCIYRDKSGLLTGTNTDGEAAILSIQTLIGNANIKNVLILGTGGTAKAISAYIRKILNEKTKIVIAFNVNKMTDRELNQFGIDEQIKYEEINEQIQNIDLLINATILGGTQAVGKSPITSKDLTRLPRSSLIFDVNYQPETTKLIEYAQQQNLRSMNGKMMNLSQAILAFQYVNPEIANIYGQEYIRREMEKE
jgi:shikimate dehydrogenase